MRSVALAFPDDPSSPVWTADRLAASAGAGAVRPTGHAALDAELPGGGWPAAGLTELLLPTPGCGELRLLAPALAASALLWVAPPWLPYAPALARLGVAVERLTVVTPATPADAAWAADQALRSGALAAVLWWQGDASVRSQSSPAPLRLALSPAGASKLAVDVFKRRGPPMAAPLVLTLPGPAFAPPRARRAPVPLLGPPDAVVRPALAGLAA
jgi:protein ImuA